MSKDIKAGTWWLDEDGDIVYIALDGMKSLPLCALDKEFPFVCLYKTSDGIFVAQMCEAELIRELPGCTGFDYKEPPVVFTPGDHPTQWVPMMGVDGQVYHCLGYLVPNR